MTPLIRWFAARTAAVSEAHWFDLGALPEYEGLSVDGGLIRRVSRLPFEVCAVCFVDADGSRSMLRLTQGANGITATGLVAESGGGLRPVRPVYFLVYSGPQI